VNNGFVLESGMGRKQRKAISQANVPDTEQRVILATGSYTGEGFDDARRDTLFLGMPMEGVATTVRRAASPFVRQQTRG
jgi:hypothetical protein